MKCLILGGNGFIGSHLLDKLLLEGHEVCIFDKYDERYRKRNLKVDYRTGDFGNRGLLADALEKIDIVFHLVSTTLPKTSNDDPAFDVQSNIIETIFLLEQCVAQRVKKLVFISSGGTVYGRPGSLPIAEDSPTEPECSYGITKLAIEKYLKLFNHLYGLEYVIIRPSNPYGSRQDPAGIQGAISVFLGRLRTGRQIEIWGDGNVIRDYIYIDDLVEGIVKAAITNTSSHVFNLGSGEGHSLNQILDVIRHVTGCEPKVTYTPARSFDIPEIYLDISKAMEELSWFPKTKLRVGIEDTWNFIKSIL